MKSFLVLLKVQLRANPLFRTSDKSGKKRGKGAAVALGLLLLLAFAQVGFMYYTMADAILSFAVPQGLTGPVITLLVLAVSLMVAFFGIFEVLGRLFLAKDGEFLASLPVPPATVFLAKLGVVYLYQLLLSVVVLALPLILAGIKLGAGVLFYVKMVFGVVLFPLLPLSVGALLSLLLMRLTALTKNRDRFMMVSSILMMLVILGGQFALTSLLPQDMSTDYLATLLQNARPLMERVASAWPPAAWLSLFITGSGTDALAGGGLFLLSTLAAGCLCYASANYLYRRGMQASLETGSGSGKKRRKAAKEEKILSPVRTLARREMRTVLRVPIYALNSLSGIIIVPLMLAYMLFSPSMKEAGDFASFISPAIAAFVAAGMLTFVGGLNPAAATMLSREGKSAWLLKAAPLSAQDIIKSKLYAGLLISLIVLLPSLAVLLILLPQHILPVLLGSLAALLFTAALNAFGLLIDFMRPRFNWNDYTQAIKQNTNVLFVMLVEMLLIGLMIMGAIFLTPLLGLWGVLALFIVAGALLCALTYWVLMKIGVRRLNALEV